MIGSHFAPVIGIAAAAKERSDGFVLVWPYLVPSA